MGSDGQGMGGMSRGDYGLGDSSDSPDLASASQTRSASSRRRPRSSGPGRFAREEEEEPDAGPGAPKGKAGGKAAPRTRKKETVKGMRWVVVTGIYPHGQQLEEYLKAQVSEDPDYQQLKVERRELQSDRTFSAWARVDVKQKKVTRLIPRNEKEDLPKSVIFPALVAPLPELAAGQWANVDREEARDAALELVGGPRRGNTDGAMEDEEGAEDGEEMEESRSGAAAVGPQGASGAGYSRDSRGMPESAMRSGTSGGGMAGGMSGGPGGGGMAGGMSGGPGGGGMGGGMGQGGSGGMGQGGSRQPPPQGAAGATATNKQGPTRTPIQRSNAKNILVRFVDYTVEPDHTYQYRLKVVVANPNEGRDDVAEDHFKKPRVLEGDWSQPSQPVHVPPDKEFYVLEKFRRGEEAKVEVHKWIDDQGEWQFRDFSVSPGDPIGEAREHEVVTMDDVIEKRRVDFSTEETLVDLTGGNRMFSFDGFGQNINETIPAEVLVVNKYGDLVTQSEDFAKASGDRKERVEEITRLLKDASKNKKEDKKAAEKPESGGQDDFEPNPRRKTREE